MKNTLFAIGALALAIGAQAQQIKLTPDNIDEVVAAMTLEEKASLLVGGGNKGFEGSTAVIGSTDKLVPGAAGFTVSIPRVGITPSVLTDGPAGVRIAAHRDGDSNTYYATGFPVGVSLASTWNPELVEAVGTAMGNEVLEYGCDVLLAPGMNIHRSPLCGRNFEYYSEDPVVTGKTAAAFVRGIQSNGVGTSLKHYAANSQETNRTKLEEVVSPRALREIYLKGFEIAVKEAKPWTVMSSYNKLNGPYTQENRELLTDILRDEWGFDGIVMTDWIGLRNTAAQVHAGNDLMEPGKASQVLDIIEKVNSGVLSEADVDLCVKRMLEYIVKTPHFKGYNFSNKPDLKAHAQVTRDAATEGMVLLKNDGNALPMTGKEKVALFGVTSYDFIAGGTGSGDVNKAYTIDLTTGLDNAGVKINPTISNYYEAYKKYCESKDEVNGVNRSWFWGKQVLAEPELTRKGIELAADDSDMAIITLGRQAGEGADRQVDGDFNLTDTERKLLTDVTDAFHARGKKVVVILNTGGVMEIASWNNLPDAILLAWQPGQEGGNSVADVLTGKVNPSGKLTMTWPVAAIDHPSSLDYPNVRANVPKDADGLRPYVDYTIHNEGINVGYRYFDTVGKAVAYPFGYGLSYTTFAYSKPTVKADADGFTATITVTNNGKVAGKEVVELYVAAPEASDALAKPAKELKAYAKTRTLQPGESQTLTFKVDNYSLASFHDVNHEWVADKGTYNIMFGASVADIRDRASYKLGKTLLWPVHDVLKPTREVLN